MLVYVVVGEDRAVVGCSRMRTGQWCGGVVGGLGCSSGVEKVEHHSLW